jgi:hypothetical protein
MEGTAVITSLKPKECQGCGSMFSPRSSFARACCQRCATKVVNADKKAERVQTKARKEAIKTIPELRAEAQVEFNKFIRTRDEGRPCISCGKPQGDLSGLHAGRDAGHYRSTGAASHLRFDERNCHAQCVHCNQHLAGNVVAYRIGLVARIGLDAVEALEADNEVVRWDRETLRQIKTIYRAKARALKKEQE